MKHTSPVDKISPGPRSAGCENPDLPARERAQQEPTSYRDILKSSALIGASSLLSIAVGVVRTKAMALMLGPAGFGLLALYSSIVDFALSIATMGIGSSGVRQIAASVSTGDAKCLGRTVAALRITAIVLGALGAGLIFAGSSRISALTFGSETYSGAVALLGLAVLFRAVSVGQGALIQGMRRIKDLAVMGVLGALFGTISGIVVVFFFGIQGLAPAVVVGAAIGLALSWRYSRKIAIGVPEITASEISREAASLLKLGFVFMAGGMFTMGAAYAVRVILLRTEGMDAAGYYSAAWTLGGLYLGIILQAMGADFYPRLVGVAQDNAQCNRLVNEQVQVSLLLACPGVIATLTFAPFIIALFYSEGFVEAVDALRWICLGIAIRVISWPMGFIIVAKNRQAIYLFAEVAWTSVNLALTWVCVETFGLKGAGIAFFGSYVFHGVMIYLIVALLTGYRWSAANVRTGLLFLSSIAAVFWGLHALPPVLAYGGGAFATAISGWYCMRSVLGLVGTNRAPAAVRRWLVRLRFAACDEHS